MTESRTARERILISGGTSGIGLATARYLATTHDVWILGSSESKVADVAATCSVAGASRCDVADEDQVRQCVADVARCLGGLDGVFVNAGIDGEAKPATDLSLDHFRRVLDVNVLGAFNVAREALAYLSRPGAVVLNASVNALRPEVQFLDYNVSKAAVVSMAKSLALEISHEGVSVIALCPGYLPTPMTQAYIDDPEIRRELLSRIPAGRFGDPLEIAQTVEFLLSPAARFMTGSVVSFDGGASV